jgi:membrane protease subunit HflK
VNAYAKAADVEPASEGAPTGTGRGPEEVCMSDSAGKGAQAVSPGGPLPLADPYRRVVVALYCAAALGTALMTAGWIATRNPVVLDAAIALLFASGLLIQIAMAQSSLAKPRRVGKKKVAGCGEGEESAPRPASPPLAEAPDAPASPGEPVSAGRPSLRERRLRAGRQSAVDAMTVTIVLAGAALVGAFLARPGARSASTGMVVAVAAVASLGAWLGGMASAYLSTVDAGVFPEAPSLVRGARLLAWMLVAAAVSTLLGWVGWKGGVQVLHLVALLVLTIAWAERLLGEKWGPSAGTFPSELRVASALGSRANPLASLLDAAQRQLGIDLRSTWALSVVRRGLWPALGGLLLLGWFLTALTVVGPDAQGLVEHFGVLDRGPPLGPGLHLHWPWPVDRVFVLSVRTVRTLHIGHEAQAMEKGPEDVLWARQHAAHEYTLLLGNGRDLIAIDAALEFRIRDPRAWRYECSNPEQALRAIAYRAVMKATVNRTLDGALSQNVATLTAHMRDAVQADADGLGLGVEVTAFTVGGMHPPVDVAPYYQRVVSAELGKTTAAIQATAYRNALVPAAQATAATSVNEARAEAAEAEARAKGEAGAFVALEKAIRESRALYWFRARLEALESALARGSFTVVDQRIERDGGKLWLLK